MMVSFKFVLLSLSVLCVMHAALGDMPAPPSTTENEAVRNRLSFDRILVVLLENQPLKASLKNAMMKNIISKGTLLVNYYGLVNPSQPNYIGLLAGDLMGVSGDSVYDIDGNNLVDLLEAKNVSWKSYQEDYPGNCFAGEVTPDNLYKRKHNPFISFNNIRNDPERCAKIVNAVELQQDLANGTVPQYSFYTPNMNNNGHDTGLAFAARWLSETFLPTYLIPFNNTGNSLLVITFDEGVPGDNQIYTLLIGDMIPEGNIDETRYNHYSLLRLIEENYGLGSLNRRDVHASQITKKYFVKGVPHLPNDNAQLVLSILLPSAAVIILAGVGFGYYYHKKRTQFEKLQPYSML